ncbi:MAG: hypothetical protein ACPG5B_08835 [Chitinophagales bacterium]
MLKNKKHALYLFLFLLQTSYIFAQKSHEIKQNYLQLSFEETQRAGSLRYMLFHNTRATNLAFHQHYLYEPFTESVERYQKVRLTGQYYLNRQTLLRIEIPYLHNKRMAADTLYKSEKGIGDIVLTAKYEWLNSDLLQVSSKIGHHFLFGSSVSLPTGKYQNFIKNEVEPRFQVGKGSANFAFHADYLLQIADFSWLNSATYQHFLPNKYTYKYGNSWHFATQFQYQKNIGKFTILPSLSFDFRQQKSDRQNERDIDFQAATSGEILYVSPQIGLQHDKYNITASWQTPIFQDLDGGQLAYKNNFNLKLRYLFQKEKRYYPLREY